MKYYVVNAFTTEQFHGNPAGVCIVDTYPEAELMQKIAAENKLSETAFIRPIAAGEYEIRWFTPGAEVELCGHATLGSSYVLAHYLEPEQEHFLLHSKSGDLFVNKLPGDRYELDFPTWEPKQVEITDAMRKALGFEPLEAWLSTDLMMVVDSVERVKTYQPDIAAIEAVSEGRGFFLTAAGGEGDFVSRTFFPKIAIDEDPVTGSANCTLVPYWSKKLNKKELINHQLSERTGVIYCQDAGERVKISGNANLYLAGEINI